MAVKSMSYVQPRHVCGFDISRRGEAPYFPEENMVLLGSTPKIVIRDYQFISISFFEVLL